MKYTLSIRKDELVHSDTEGGEMQQHFNDS